MKVIRFILGFGLIIFFLTTGLNAGAGAGDMNGKVRTMAKADFENIVKAHKNKVLMINVWATWCKPCREEFPDLVKLQDYYKGKDVRIVSISADYPDEIDSKIKPFLDKFNLNFPVYVQNFPKQDQFIDYMNPKWSGALPATFIYDKSGKQQTVIIGKQSFESFREEIEKFRSKK
ncbi:MAG: TlpA family protein disulfide reductase [bacterium]|nr:TlpA family protein disulfide reductase [bacterium]